MAAARGEGGTRTSGLGGGIATTAVLGKIAAAAAAGGGRAAAPKGKTGAAAGVSRRGAAAAVRGTALTEGGGSIEAGGRIAAAEGCTTALIFRTNRREAAMLFHRPEDDVEGLNAARAAATEAAPGESTFPATPTGRASGRKPSMRIRSARLLLPLVLLACLSHVEKGNEQILHIWGAAGAPPVASLSAVTLAPSSTATVLRSAAAAVSLSLILLLQSPTTALCLRVPQTPWGKRDADRREKEQQQKQTEGQQHTRLGAAAGVPGHRLSLTHDTDNRSTAGDEERVDRSRGIYAEKYSSSTRDVGGGGDGNEEGGGTEEESTRYGDAEGANTIRPPGEEESEGVFFQQQSVEDAMARVDPRRAQMLATALELKYGFDGSTPDLKRAMEVFKDLAAVGEKDAVTAQALYELADLQLRGIPGTWGISRDIDAAVASFEGAAALGYGPALHALGNAYAMGLGPLKANEAEATRLQYLASLTDYIPAVLAMGFRYFYGDGVALDCEEALRHYKFAAERAVLLVAPQLLLPRSYVQEEVESLAAEALPAQKTESMSDGSRSSGEGGVCGNEEGEMLWNRDGEERNAEEEWKQEQLREAAEAAVAAGGVMVPPVPLGDGDRLTPYTKQQFRDFQAAQQQQPDVLRYWEERARKKDPMAQYELAKQLEMQQLQHLRQQEQLQQQLQQELQQQLSQHKLQQQCPGGKCSGGRQSQTSWEPQQEQQFLQMLQQQLQEATEKNQKMRERIRLLLEKSAQQGLAPALRDLGLLHLQDRQDGTGNNLKKALHYFKRAAARGDAEAQNYLAYLYYAGASAGDCPGDRSNHNGEATEAATEEPATEQRESCFSIKRDRQLATWYFSQAALSEFPEALFFLVQHVCALLRSLSLLLQLEKKEEKKRYIRALRYYQRAADGGYVLAAWREAQLLDAGKGVERSCEAAALAYKAIAEAGPWVEDVRRGYMQYVEGDIKGAMLTFGFAAEEGYSIAQMNTAFCYKQMRSSWIPSNYSDFSRFLFFRRKSHGQQQFAPWTSSESDEERLFRSNSNDEKSSVVNEQTCSTTPAPLSHSNGSDNRDSDSGGTRGTRKTRPLASRCNRSCEVDSHAGTNRDHTNSLQSSTEAASVEEDAAASTGASVPQEYRMINRAALQGDPAALRSVALAHISGMANSIILKSPALAKDVLHMALSLGDLKELERALDLLQFHTEAGGKRVLAGPQKWLHNGGVLSEDCGNFLLRGKESLYKGILRAKLLFNLAHLH